MINTINLKTVLRNKRFLIFTIVFPAIWFIFMDLGIGTFAKNLTMTWFIISALMGIIGNSIVTFGKRIGNSKEYYLISIKTTPYTPFRWIMDSMMQQTLLNLLILCILTLEARILGAISFDLSTLLLIVILLPLGIYLSFIGFLIGVIAKKELLDMAGFPIMCLVALFISPFYTFAQNKFFDVVTDIQKMFPGYYVIKLANVIQNGGSYEKLAWLFALTFVIHVAIILLLFFREVKKGIE
ncbi:hypothetical protein AKUH3B209X_15180 [Apilactobacillus kunkeei]|nr:hypothetical protein [Lactobacillus sp. M0345]CAI2671791.1 hypothetical protein AKUH4B405J_15030 [Apilactobacillus kunkeei]CAI2672891.1 hypothetical protein AKUH4B410M_15020 [Apilactobacillus kunkeei]CAI2672925.1 hypothetical protein AKUH4B102A_15320 [Apilactobacillus kunkeei]CAI2676774.1 hypothetical protein AKUH3B209X_15180 [Apilactobacillus kunkeei]